jgi:RNA polymerase sigma-70 factor (ECF subfamily)
MEPITKLLWERSEQGLAELARKFGKRLYQTAMNIIGIREDAEEAVNDTYLAVWNVIPPQQPEPLAPYVYRGGGTSP